jgi:hypothetical protein
MGWGYRQVDALAKSVRNHNGVDPEGLLEPYMSHCVVVLGVCVCVAPVRYWYVHRLPTNSV